MKQMHRILKARAYIEEETLRRMLRWMVPSAIQTLGTEDSLVITTVATEHEKSVSGRGALSMFSVHDAMGAPTVATGLCMMPKQGGH